MNIDFSRTTTSFVDGGVSMEPQETEVDTRLELIETVQSKDSSIVEYILDRADVRDQIEIVKIGEKHFIHANSIYTNTVVHADAFATGGLVEVKCLVNPYF